MTDLEQNTTDLVSTNQSQKNWMLAIYILFAASILFGGIPTLVGAIIAYVKRDEMKGTFYESHITYLIRTFFVAFIGGILGLILSFIGIGIILLFIIGIWYIFRVVVGMIKFFDKKTVTTTGWFM
ncbi:DUF4870 family protein [Phocoenobacter skyensis]|uniref:Uncharacterized membrane protein n=1 Tax=Phocoenobacter skyensis TaxID=97481 RepID=A0A1H7WFN3_9PAST|nr:hypothetical protein [Pasteurella skyensis]MDP8079214.1 hypothetical protein [Pasteurella skyensis]MDP8085176.1 hypothetical protein [Pasteurella skyensis]MDP8170013.1 hypothetical protein [Pasteurella skyensis]MDP8175116.1 hypothetical protein [Pasteurella skyensis]MDP8185093.1 hypothetical protein [Pasteurella skyensis]